MISKESRAQIAASVHVMRPQKTIVWRDNINYRSPTDFKRVLLKLEGMTNDFERESFQTMFHVCAIIH